MSGITPARAGNTIYMYADELGDWNYPRSRGEYGLCSFIFFDSEELPPLARGIHPEDVAKAKGFGITPARAGNTLPRWLRLFLSRNYPRSRGEYTVSQAILD